MTRAWRAFRMQVVDWSVNWVCAGRQAYALMSVGLVACYVMAVVLLGFETTSGHICIMRDYAEMDPSAATVEAVVTPKSLCNLAKHPRI